MSKHTPGPWRINGYKVCENNTDDVIAEPGKNFDLINPSQILDANASLIAAAPDLLEELEQVERDLAIQKRNFSLGTASHTAMSVRLESVRAAIAKAEGEST